ncbi:hypothetical protein [Thioalkalivibrio thiocyanodenitrificans]|uniref:hypothetical protein n=1 Tax=Thioalkalivibrio thiocyanodenitrificans TaxID=243063 RepID=UPI00036708B9|nr:hypothetical protein [Thioalkalivibrio thiocyanodenitrificans]
MNLVVSSPRHGPIAGPARRGFQVIAILAICALALATGCATTGTPSSEPTSASGMTHGNVQLNLRKGETTQAEVLEVFGAPNIATYDAEGQEVWTYQRHATVTSSQSTSSYGTIILFGGSSRTSGFEQSSRTMTLIIKFDEDKKVSDFRSRTSSF